MSQKAILFLITEVKNGAGTKYKVRYYPRHHKQLGTQMLCKDLETAKKVRQNYVINYCKNITMDEVAIKDEVFKSRKTLLLD